MDTDVEGARASEPGRNIVGGGSSSSSFSSSSSIFQGLSRTRTRTRTRRGKVRMFSTQALQPASPLFRLRRLRRSFIRDFNSSPMRLSEMREVLEARGIQLSKSLGQNFLHDGNQLRRIVEAAELTKQDKVLEIGPGFGPLTEMLLEKAGEVLAIEKDARLVEVLRERFDAGQASRLPSPRPGAGHEEIA